MTGVKEVAMQQSLVPAPDAFPAAPGDPMLAMIERLVTDPNADVGKLERLVAMHERAIARQAETAFNAAMSEAQHEMRPIAANATNPQTKSKYATYDALDAALRPIYTDHGFGLSFDTTESTLADHVRVLCYVTHAGGHARTYQADMPADGKGARGGDVMTKTHAVGAAISYGMRYVLKMIFNVAVGEADRDGNQVTATPDAPTGFEDFVKELRKLADKGAAMYEFWNKSSAELRQHVTRHYADDWRSLRAKADAATKGGGK